MTVNELGEEFRIGRGARNRIARETNRRRRRTKARPRRRCASQEGARHKRTNNHRRGAGRATKQFGEDESMDEQTVKRIQNDPNYIKLVAERKSFGWTLAIITLVIYYGYIALVAFAPGVIATPVSGAITVGIILGAAIIVASIVLTGIYVGRANSHYDELTKAIVNAAAMGGK
jgi:uncharacterized membrane protein (DUF485 family)